MRRTRFHDWVSEEAHELCPSQVTWSYYSPPTQQLRKGGDIVNPYLINQGPDTADTGFDGVLSGPEISLAHLS